MGVEGKGVSGWDAGGRGGLREGVSWCLRVKGGVDVGLGVPK